MTGLSGPSFRGLQEAIDELSELSMVFTRRFVRGQMDRDNRVTIRAMMCFDYISNEIMRVRDNALSAGTFAGSAFENSLAPDLGLMVKPTTLAQQVRMCAAGAGRGELPTDLTPPERINVGETLNKVKHRNPDLINFRMQGDRHIFLVCPNKMRGRGPEGIVEFDVEEFCSRCSDVAAVL